MSARIALEGFNEFLHVKISKSLPNEEFHNFVSEILSNYISDLKEKGKISRTQEDLIIVNEDDHKELHRSQIKALENFKKIIIGFSNAEKLVSEVSKNITMNALNKQTLDKSYKDVEKSLSMARESKSSV